MVRPLVLRLRLRSALFATALLAGCGAASEAPGLASPTNGRVEPATSGSECFDLSGRWRLLADDGAYDVVEMSLVATSETTFDASGPDWTGTGTIAGRSGSIEWSVTNGLHGASRIWLDELGRLHGTSRGDANGGGWAYTGDRIGGPPIAHPCP